MEIVYKDIRTFTAGELERLFLSVNWESGHFPQKLVAAMQHSDTVYSAWDGDRLVGLMNALTDHSMTAYFHYLLVDPEYQGQSIGTTLVKRVLAHYWDIPVKMLLCDEGGQEYYKKLGFDDGNELHAVYISDLY